MLAKIVREKCFFRAKIRSRSSEGKLEIEYVLLLLTVFGAARYEELWEIEGKTHDPAFNTTTSTLGKPKVLWKSGDTETLPAFLEFWLTRQHGMYGRDMAAPAAVSYTSYANAAEDDVAPTVDPILVLLSRLQGYLYAVVDHWDFRPPNLTHFYERFSVFVEQTARERGRSSGSRFPIPKRRH